MTVDEIWSQLAAHPKVVAIGEAGLDYHYDNSPRDAQSAGFRTHIAAARATGLPLVIHARDADDDMAAHPRGGDREGRLPRRAALLHRRARSSPGARLALGLYVSFSGILTFKSSEAICAPSPRACRLDRLLVETDAPYLAPRPYRGKRNEPAYVVETAKVLARGARRHAERDRAADHGKLLPPVRQGAAAEPAPAPHDAAVHDPRLRLVRRRAARRQRLGRLRPGQSEEPPPPLLAAGRARAARAAPPGAGRHRRRTCASSCSTPASMARRRALHPRPRRPHPRHRRSARLVFITQRRGRRLCRPPNAARILMSALRLLLRDAARQRLSADPRRARHRPGRAGADRRGRAAPIEALPFLQMHGDIAVARLPLRRRSPIRPTSAACRTRSLPLLQGLDVWIVDALRYRAASEPFQRRRRRCHGSSASASNAASSPI